MKDVQATELPRCDACGKPGCGVYNAPLDKRKAPVHMLGKGSWANLCGPCFEKCGLDTSVTERRVLPKTHDEPGGWGTSPSTGSIVSKEAT